MHNEEWIGLKHGYQHPDTGWKVLPTWDGESGKSVWVIQTDKGVISKNSKRVKFPNAEEALERAEKVMLKRGLIEDFAVPEKVEEEEPETPAAVKVKVEEVTADDFAVGDVVVLRGDNEIAVIVGIASYASPPLNVMSKTAHSEKMVNVSQIRDVIGFVDVDKMKRLSDIWRTSKGALLSLPRALKGINIGDEIWMKHRQETVQVVFKDYVSRRPKDYPIVYEHLGKQWKDSLSCFLGKVV